jgi:hypothetical protein
MSFGFALVYTAVVSIPPTKVDWYLAPMYPLLALSIAIPIVEWLKSDFLGAKTVLKPAFIFILLVTGGVAAHKMFTINEAVTEFTPLEYEGQFARELHRQQPALKNYIITMQSRHEEHYHQALFYKRLYNQGYGYNIRFTPFLSQIQPTDTVLVCQGNKIDSLQRMGFTEIVAVSKKYSECRLLVRR